MTVFTDRVAALEQVLEKRRSPRDGGWPQKLGLDGGATSIVATAQVIEILRIRGLDHHDPMIQSGLRYLAEQLPVQTAPDGKAGGRGEWTRFPAYALWGLMRYPAARHEGSLWDGISFAYKRLQAWRLPAGGWPQEPGGQRMWMPVTMVAVHALDRLGLYGGSNLSKETAALTTAARDHVAEIGQTKGRSQCFWTQTLGGEACPGITSLAVLTLARGSSAHRDIARAGINWLDANKERWTRHVHRDEEVNSRRWRLHSFSLGLRALMHPCGERSVSDPAIAEVVGHFETLWKADQHGWTDRADPDMEASVSGSYAVISAVHTLKRVWPFDPFEHLKLKRPRRKVNNVAVPRAARVLEICVAEQGMRLTDESNGLILQTTISGSSQWKILFTLATRHHEAKARGSRDQTETTVSLEELARLGNGGKGVQPETVWRTIDRLHAKLETEAGKRSRKRFAKLIDPHVPPDTREDRFALEEIEVRFVDCLPPVSAD